MPVRNEERFIKYIARGAKQDYPSDRFEIIVSDGESIDG
jgi:glycosyltransferase involved in cell wall biosynthesis